MPRRFFAPSFLCLLVSLTVSLLCVLPPAHAGQYVLASCTGGGAGGNPLTGYYTNSSIYIRADPSGNTATSLTASIGGTGSDAPGPLVATLQWQPSNASDLPPPALIIRHYCDAVWIWGGAGDGTGTGAADNDLGSPARVQSWVVGGSVDCQGYGYTVISAPGLSPKVTLNPSAKLTVKSGVKRGAYAGGGPKFQWHFDVYPVTLTLGGTTKDSSGKDNILVGQNCSPHLNILGLPSGVYVGWPTWSVSGGTYTSFDIGAGQNTGSTTPFPDPIWNISVNPPPANPTFFWKDANIAGTPETVQGSAVLYNTILGTLYNPSLPPSAQIGTVTASKKVKVYRPDVYSTPQTVGPHGVLENSINPQLGTVGINTGNHEVASNDPSGNSSGYYLKIAVATPSLFTQGQTVFGNWGWLQLCQLNVTQGGNGTQMAVPKLDSSFPYNNTGGVANGVPGLTYDARLLSNGSPAYDAFDDSPSEQYYDYFLRYDTALSFDNNFHLYVIYGPPDAGNGVNYVPVNRYDWEFTASMTRSGLNGIWTPNPPGSVKNIGSAPYPEYPTWTSKYSP